jgi:hypothetical protein
MVAELESHGGFVDRALVRERFHVSSSPLATELTVTKLVPSKLLVPLNFALKLPNIATITLKTSMDFRNCRSAR